MYCRTGSNLECTAKRQYIGMYNRIGSISEYTAEEAAYRNVLQNRQHIGIYCKTSSMSVCTAEQGA